MGESVSSYVFFYVCVFSVYVSVCACIAVRHTDAHTKTDVNMRSRMNTRIHIDAYRSAPNTPSPRWTDATSDAYDASGNSLRVSLRVYVCLCVHVCLCV